MSTTGLSTANSALTESQAVIAAELTRLSAAIDAFYAAQLAVVNATNTAMQQIIAAHTSKSLGSAHLRAESATFRDASGDIVSNRVLRIVTRSGQTFYVPAAIV